MDDGWSGLEVKRKNGDGVSESSSISSQRALIRSCIEQDAELKEYDVRSSVMTAGPALK